MVIQPRGCSGLIWRKSRASADSAACVEIASLGMSVLVRDSHNRTGEPLALSIDQWRRLVTRIRNGDLDWPDGS
jgi:Domain of unknown function (DUF397)